VRVLACPASLKGALPAIDAAAALAEGLRRADGVEVEELPVADGGEGTLEVLAHARAGARHVADVHDAFGRPRIARWLQDGGNAYVEAAQAIPLDPARRDPIAASSRGLGELINAIASPRRLYIGLGGTANVDGGAGFLEVVDKLPAPTTVACDVDAPLLDAVRVFAAQKGATPEQFPVLEERLEPLLDYSELPGAGAAGGLGAALASLGAELAPGAALVLDLLGFDPSPYDLVVTGEGTVDATTVRGKAPGEVARRCSDAGVRCLVFGGRVVERVPHAETVALSGDPARAREDLRRLGGLSAPD
jgi:glycerate kinase